MTTPTLRSQCLHRKIVLRKNKVRHCKLSQTFVRQFPNARRILDDWHDVCCVDLSCVGGSDKCGNWSNIFAASHVYCFGSLPYYGFFTRRCLFSGSLSSGDKLFLALCRSIH